MEKLFYVKPGAKPEDIKVKLTGARSVKIAETERTGVETDLGRVKFTKPVAYQELAGKRVEITVNYYFPDSPSSTADSGRIYGFRLGDYDRTREVLVNRPASLFNIPRWKRKRSRSGGTVDNSGKYLYCRGDQLHPIFPRLREHSTGASTAVLQIFSYPRLIPPETWYIPPLSVVGSANDYDPNSGEPYVFGMTIDASGNAYMTGQTFSGDFPTTAGALSRTLKGNSDAFVLKLNFTGDSLVYSTLIGGTGDDQGAGIAVDTSGNAYMAGTTWSSDFPTTTGAIDRIYHGGDSDMFVIKINPSGSGLVYSTFLGGSGWDQATEIAIDNGGNAYVLGGGNSTDYPTTDRSV